MDNTVVIKGNKHGILVILDDTMDFQKLKECIRDKFSSAAKFFGDADMAISFEGRVLSTDEVDEILDIISSVSDLRIVCVMDHDEEKDSMYVEAVRNAKKAAEETHTSQNLDARETCDDNIISDMSQVNTAATAFCKGTLRSGQLFEAENSVVVLGDVNPGGKVVSKGNVIVLGSLRGNVYAGADGNENAFVVALEMRPMQIKIADVIARSADTSTHKKSKNKSIQPKIAYVGDGNIYIDDLLQEVLNDITI